MTRAAGTGARGAAALMDAALALAQHAGAAALEHFRPGIAVDLKGDGSPVTVADREAERAARAWLAGRFPDDGMLGEEFGDVNPHAPRRWIVDPVDGTRSFVRGVPLWGTLIALAEGERVIAGAACFPALGEGIAAARGCGCWWNGERCAVSTVSELGEAAVMTTDERFPGRPERRAAWARLAARAGLARTWGDAYGYLLVATGRADAMVDDRVAPWDAAPFSVIVEEAGGAFTDWKGVPTAFGGDAIATNRGLAESVRRALAG